jgi:hypothetical protein
MYCPVGAGKTRTTCLFDKITQDVQAIYPTKRKIVPAMALENRCTTELNIPQRDKPEGDKQVFSFIPAGCWGQPKDLFGALIFPSLKVSIYMLGAFLPIDGGFLAQI